MAEIILIIKSEIVVSFYYCYHFQNALVVYLFLYLSYIWCHFVTLVDTMKHFFCSKISGPENRLLSLSISRTASAITQYLYTALHETE